MKNTDIKLNQTNQALISTWQKNKEKSSNKVTCPPIPMWTSSSPEELLPVEGLRVTAPNKESQGFETAKKIGQTRITTENTAKTTKRKQFRWPKIISSNSFLYYVLFRGHQIYLLFKTIWVSQVFPAKPQPPSSLRLLLGWLL